MSDPRIDNSPLSYGQWAQQQESVIQDVTETGYIQYLKNWYKGRDQFINAPLYNQKQDFIQLLKDLNFLFGQSEESLFLKDIDYNKDEDLILAIPYFASKLKDIAKVLNTKRESVKRARAKYGLIGSNIGLETLLYDYVLKSFTKREGNLTQLPSLALQAYFPELTAVKDTFFIEVEELYDTETYHDSDPSVSIQEYVNVDNLKNYIPLVDKEDPFTEQEILNLIATRFYPRALSTPLFQNFVEYLPSILNTPLSSYLTDVKNKEVWASQRFLSENVYGVTAVRLQEVLEPDYQLNFNMAPGSNWFLWPSGFQTSDNKSYNNYFEPIYLTSAAFVDSGATYGNSYLNSDLIFSDKNGLIEGAWLQGPRFETSKGSSSITIKGGETMEFLFPYVGFSIDSKTLQFGSHTLTERDNRFFNALDKSVQQQLLSQYYTLNFPNSASKPIYLNNTTLIRDGAVAGKFSYEADNITIWPRVVNVLSAYNVQGNAQQSYLFKFNRTDLIIGPGDTNIHWPIQRVLDEQNSGIFCDKTTCLPVALASINPSYDMAGAVAGLNIATSDVIYKLSSKSEGSKAVEAAWLGAEPLSAIDLLQHDIPVYKNKATNCADCLNGPINGSTFSFIAEAGKRVSFIWTGPDTYADEVFKYFEHADNCEYGKTMPHDYYANQDYLNTSAITQRQYWKKCACRATLYSPIGHAGESIGDYNGITDCLYADPNNMGENFSYTKWKDTRGFSYKDSPQFAFFQLYSKEGDSPVGFGPGRWITGGSEKNSYNQNRMVLKPNRMYTYYRSSMRRDIDLSSMPNLVVNYVNTKNPPLTIAPSNTPTDLVILMDISRSLTYNFDSVKSILSKMISKVNKYFVNSTQVGLIAFNKNDLTLNYLTQNWYALALSLNTLRQENSYPNYTTDLKVALEAGAFILNNAIPTGTNGGVLKDLKQLCSNLNTTITNYGQINQLTNLPQTGAKKKILLLSDGVDGHATEDLIKQSAETLKTTGIEIYTINVGPLSFTNNLLKDIASSDQTYFDLERYLVSGDGTEDGFVDYIARKINGSMPVNPVWRKAVRNESGTWVGLNEISDMVLNPGDYLIYNHKDRATFTNVDRNKDIFTPSINFTINVKLDGWDYDNNTFSPLNIGPNYGAKPFWAQVPTNTISVAGQVKFALGYVPVHQPHPSTSVLYNGDYIQYQHYDTTDMVWTQPITFNTRIDDIGWKQLYINKTYSNLYDVLRSGKIDTLIEQTNYPSNMLLEGFSQYKPARYHYIARTGFTYQQNLYFRNRCGSSFVQFITGHVIKPLEPYNNLTNKFYPTIASISFPELTVTEKEVGGYMLPDKFGVSTYRGRGYTFEIDQNALSAVDSLSAERVFLDPNKYGSKNRGLTKKQQLFPTIQKDLDNKWIMEPFGSGSKSGVILGTKENQKFTPYQSAYEILGYNPHGLARQDDAFQFWTFGQSGVQWNQKNPNLNSRQEFLSDNYPDRINKLLTNKGSMTQWRTDIFGNDYGLYKFLSAAAIDPVASVNKVAPLISYQSGAKTLNLNQYQPLAVQAVGTEPFSYQWYKDLKPILGGNNATYIIYKASSQDAGMYYCVISNIAGKITSDNISVVVTDHA